MIQLSKIYQFIISLLLELIYLEKISNNN